MSILKIARMGHPVLRQVAEPVSDPCAPAVRRLARDMIETMVDAEGVGLAAPQVHESLRLIVFVAAEAREQTTERRPVVLLNPEIEPLDQEEVDGFEGCLSIPGLRGLVPRAARIGYRGIALDGRPVEREATGLHARVVQHEVDHLDGILYPSRMPDLRYLTFDSELKHFMAQLGGGQPQDD